MMGLEPAHLLYVGDEKANQLQSVLARRRAG